jgi:hypothetical protein
VSITKIIDNIPYDITFFKTSEGITAKKTETKYFSGNHLNSCIFR